MIIPLACTSHANHMYEHLDMTSMISWKAWSPNRIDLCLEMFLHLMMTTQRPFIFWIIMTLGLVQMLRQDIPNQVPGLMA